MHFTSPFIVLTRCQDVLEALYKYNLIHCPNNPIEVGNYLVKPILEMSLVRHREYKQLAQGHTARKQQSWDSSPGCLAPELVLLTNLLS